MSTKKSSKSSSKGGARPASKSIMHQEQSLMQQAGLSDFGTPAPPKVAEFAGPVASVMHKEPTARDLIDRIPKPSPGEYAAAPAPAPTLSVGERASLFMDSVVDRMADLSGMRNIHQPAQAAQAVASAANAPSTGKEASRANAMVAPAAELHKEQGEARRAPKVKQAPAHAEKSEPDFIAPKTAAERVKGMDAATVVESASLTEKAFDSASRLSHALRQMVDGKETAGEAVARVAEQNGKPAAEALRSALESRGIDTDRDAKALKAGTLKTLSELADKETLNAFHAYKDARDLAAALPEQVKKDIAAEQAKEAETASAAKAAQPSKEAAEGKAVSVSDSVSQGSSESEQSASTKGAAESKEAKAESAPAQSADSNGEKSQSANSEAVRTENQSISVRLSAGEILKAASNEMRNGPDAGEAAAKGLQTLLDKAGMSEFQIGKEEALAIVDIARSSPDDAAMRFQIDHTRTTRDEAVTEQVSRSVVSQDGASSYGSARSMSESGTSGMSVSSGLSAGVSEGSSANATSQSFGASIGESVSGKAGSGHSASTSEGLSKSSSVSSEGESHSTREITAATDYLQGMLKNAGLDSSMADPVTAAHLLAMAKEHPSDAVFKLQVEAEGAESAKELEVSVAELLESVEKLNESQKQLRESLDDMDVAEVDNGMELGD